MLQQSLNRRAFLALAGLIAIAPRAFAAGRITFPLRIAYARIGPAGFAPIRSVEQMQWTALQTRTGRLIEALEPQQPTSILSPKAPEIDGGASCALAARTMAAEAGFSHVILYAIDDGHEPKKKTGWIQGCFASLRGAFSPGRATLGEAHLLSVDGGAPLISATADAPPRGLLSSRSPARETLDALTRDLERRLQDAARAAFDAQHSIADK